MATRNLTIGGGGPNEIDLIDVAALIIVPIAAALIFGVWSWEIQVFGGYDFLSPIWTLGGVDISAALLIVVFGVGWIAVTNLMNDQTDLSQIEAGVVLTALLLPILYLFVPAVENLVHWHDMMQLAAVLYVTAASVFVSYVG